jgi:hypothetical protein
MVRARGHHQRHALKHRHKHFHVTHYLHRGENWGHLLSTHTHDHNHPALDPVTSPNGTWRKSIDGKRTFTTTPGLPNRRRRSRP